MPMKWDAAAESKVRLVSLTSNTSADRSLAVLRGAQGSQRQA